MPTTQGTKTRKRQAVSRDATTLARIEEAASPSIKEMVEEYDGLEFQTNHGSSLSGGDEYTFLKRPTYKGVEPPRNIPHIRDGEDIFFMVPSDCVLKGEPWCSHIQGKAYLPDYSEDWTSQGKVAEIIGAVISYQSKAEAKILLDQERCRSDLCASRDHIPDEKPMIADGLFPGQSVSVVFGDFDEFKTTLIMDLMAHVAAGAGMWQGRKITACPVLWYALEGSDEVALRLRAILARLNDAAWGDDNIPFTVREKIPESYIDWRREIQHIGDRWSEIRFARNSLGDLPTETLKEDNGETYELLRYPEEVGEPIVVIDTLSMALGGEDEKGPSAVSFINDCLDLLKDRPDLEEDDRDRLQWAAASAIIIIHHQTKTGTEFAGHRAIAANTHALYRVVRPGSVTSREDRPMTGRILPQRAKGMARPASLGFVVEIADVPGTRQTAAILNDTRTEIPKELRPVLDALADLENPQEITQEQLNECIDVAARNRTTRKRYRDLLDEVGLIETVEASEENPKTFYRFHGGGASLLA